MDVLIVCYIYSVIYTQPSHSPTFELIEAPAATLLGSKVKCVVLIISRIGGAKVTNQITSWFSVSSNHWRVQDDITIAVQWCHLEWLHGEVEVCDQVLFYHRSCGLWKI